MGHVVSEAVVRRVIGIEGAETLLAITEGAWQDYVSEGIPRFHRSTRANIVWDYMVKRSDELLTNMDGVRRVERQDRPMYVLRERLILQPKMHTREATTRNYPTAAQAGIQASGFFPEFDFSVIRFGYQLDQAEADIERCLISSPSDSWIINVHELADGVTNPVTSLLTGMEEDLTAIQPIRRRRSS